MFWPFKKKGKNQSRGVNLRNELLYVMYKLNLIPFWLDMKNGMRIGVGSEPPRIRFKDR